MTRCPKADSRELRARQSKERGKMAELAAAPIRLSEETKRPNSTQSRKARADLERQLRAAMVAARR